MAAMSVVAFASPQVRASGVPSRFGGARAHGEFESRLELDFWIVHIGERLFQTGLGASGIARAFLGDSEERFDAPEIGLVAQGCAQRRDRIGKLVLKEEEHAEVGLAVDVLRVERDDLAK